MSTNLRAKTNFCGLVKTVLLVLCLLPGLSPQEALGALQPVKWSVDSSTPSARPGSEIAIKIRASIDEGWHLYSMTTPAGGPIPTTIRFAENPVIAGYKIYQPTPNRIFDPNFQLETETFEHEVVFLATVRVAENAPIGTHELQLQIRNQSCDERQCLPPRRTTISIQLNVDSSASPSQAITIPAGYQLAYQFPASEIGTTSPAPQASEASAQQATPPASFADEASQSLALFLIIAFGFGLASVFTPCVFPMIPITVSYFLGRESRSRAQVVAEAVVFCLGIIVLFSGLGLLVTALLGPFGMVQLGSNPWVNGFIALVFFIFALSMLGAFEITIPPSILNRLNTSASQAGGVVGTLLMGLTFSLAAFACVGPFVGTLLAASLTSAGLRPFFGMVSFATGLALPFFLLALFPAYLKKLPRSGSWLPRVKTVFGLLILAAMLKYLSNVDAVLQWGLLTRERFLATWVVIFAAIGLYLLGFLRLAGIDPNQEVGVARLLLGTFFLAFALSLIPGMFGGHLGELEAYVPQTRSTPAGILADGSGSSAGLVWLKNDYEGALAQARQEGKLVFVSFTGYACTNCHWMKANMFPRSEIAELLRHFVLVELYTDGTDEASEQNQKLQEELFSTIAIPFYAIMTPDGKVVATFAGLTRDPQKFAAFLKTGLSHQTVS